MSKKWEFHAFREEMRDPDPDKPHQALIDLNQELEKDTIQLEDSIQGPIIEDVLKQALQSSHSDVQGAAVKCIPQLVSKVKEKHVQNMIVHLSEFLIGTKKEQRDIASISLKYIVEHIPMEYKESMKTMATRLISNGLKASKEEAKLDIMDVLVDLLRRFGGIIQDEHERLQMCLLSELSSTRLPVRKRAIACLAALCVHTSDSLFQSVVNQVTLGIQKEKGESLRKYIQLCSAISRTSGQRLGRFLDTIMPELLSNVKEEKLQLIEDEAERNEVRENILQAFESFVLRCPQQVTPFLRPIISACKDGLSYDPYYEYDDDMEEDEEVEQQEDDEYGDLMEADADDDDDVSWKVRKASAKCLAALIQMRSDSLQLIYEMMCSKEAREEDLKAPSVSQRKSLCERFKEREESVRLDIFRVFSDLMKATQINPTGANAEHLYQAGMSGSYSTSFRIKVESRPEVRHLVEIKDFAVESIIKAMRDKSMKVKTTCFHLLKDLTSVLKDELEPSVPKFLKVVKEALGQRDATSALKTEVLQFLLLIVATCRANSPGLQKALPELLPLVLNCVNERYYKIISESLRVCGELVPVVVSGEDAETRTKKLYDSVHSRLSTADVDQEVKDCAIVTMGCILRHAASGSGKQLLSKDMVHKSQQQFLHMMGSDYSRIPVIKTIAMCKDVPMEPELLNKFVFEICGFLRKASRPLRQASLHCLKTLTERKAQSIDRTLYTKMLSEITPLLNDQDLHLSHLAVDLCTAILQTQPSAIEEIEDTVVPKFVDMLRSPLLQGSALESLENIFLLLGPKSKVGYQPLLTTVLNAASNAGESRQVLISVAAVAAKLTCSASPDQQAKTIERYLADLNSRSDETRALALACLGETGRFLDLSANTQVLDTIRGMFEHPKEDMKALAACSLGKIISGNVTEMLGGLVTGIEKDSAHRYLLLRTLKETLSRSDVSNDFDPLKKECGRVLKVCLEFAGGDDEGVRNVVAECLGKLALLKPKEVANGMLVDAKQQGPLSNKTATMLSALKYAISEPHFRYDGLETDLKEFLLYMSKPSGLSAADNASNVRIRRAAVQLFTAVVHCKPDMAKADLRLYIDALLSQTQVDQELIRSVNLGPFVHKVDDGLELRKSAFECMDILLDGTFGGDSLLDYLNNYDIFAKQLVGGMAQSQGQDIQMLCFFMMGKLSRLSRAHVAVLSVLDTAFDDSNLPKVLSTLIAQLGKQNIVPQDKDKLCDVMVTLFKMMLAIQRVPGAETNPKFNAFLLNVRKLSGENESTRAALTKAAEKEDMGKL